MNYRDLQNISNLSQEILIEGANEEHNVLNRWPYTSPYLQEVYNQEDYKPWDFGPKQNAQAKHAELAQRKAAGGSAPGTATRANKIASVGREMRTTLDRDSANTGTNPAKQGLQPSTQRHTAAALRGAGGGTTARTKFDVKPLKPASKGGGSSAQGAGSPSGTGRYTPGGGQGYGISGIKLADSYDLYDIILSHLLDEGYAETLEQAEVIMVNMSEDWRESILSEEPVQDYRDMKRADQNRSGIRGSELTHDTTPGLKGIPQPGRGSTTPPAPRGGGSIKYTTPTPSATRSPSSPPSGSGSRPAPPPATTRTYPKPSLDAPDPRGGANMDGSAGSVTLNRNIPGDDFIGPTVSTGGKTYGIPNPKFGRPQR